MDRDTTHDQAEKLRQTVKNSSEKLPPRSEVHKDKKKKTKIRFKYPVVRLLALFFVLIPIVILSYTFHFKDELKTLVPKVSTENYDTIDFAKPSEDESVAEGENLIEDVVNEPEKVEEPSQTEPGEKEIAGATQSDIEDEQPATNVPDNSSKQTGQKDSTKQQYKIITHKVTAEETLYSISIKYYKSRAGEEIIREWNNLEQTKIYEGQILEIPLEQNKE
ncbi:LysM peptidoglycan-binding domain-containing protein [Bacillus luteolus]|uniref:LysM peptidoglycan-binding domain-containing protein n=1 Tax=Litchfieldia luteola TaxID=682179 RepID=A0ABR9QPJ3_9BACI|nr:LysM peptidoglycan-binding domain-containing protein [Cytobacillus luteolus]MBE4910321.1 LysM peptidoglycan-binding domain-containing protein [Cytobacillus luteolus]MBP1942104.1 LysM repeat protein [Cytobacillus luteolus]